MAKQKASESEATEAAAKPAPEAGAKPKKAKEPKEPKTEGAKASPDAPAAAASAPSAAPASTAPAASQATSEKKKGKQPGIPPLRGKRLRAQLKSLRAKIAKEGSMPLKKAIGLLKQSKRAKFDETVEIHMALGIDTTQNDQMVRGSVPLPHGIGKTVRVVVFCQGDNVAKATAAGADLAGSDDVIKKIQGGWLDFDVALATQDMMGVVSRLGKVWPRPDAPPKAGTVVWGPMRSPPANSRPAGGI